VADTAAPDPADAPAPAGSAVASLAPVVPPRRRATGWAAAGLVVGAAGGALWAGRDAADPPTRASPSSRATLEPLPGRTATGDARVERAADGGRVLVVQLAGEDLDGGYREVWLIDRDVTRLVSLDVLTGAEGRLTVPPGLDLAEFPVVDVSDEPMDGDPSHSGESIIRGVLDA